MQVMIAKTYFQSKTELSGSDARRIDSFLKRLMDDPTNPGIGLERLRDVPDTNMWSARVSRDLRAILHYQGNHLIVLHVGHHDQAYAWAERRRVNPHPVTGALQIVVLPETQEATPEPQPTTAGPVQDPNLDFSRLTAQFLLAIGVPEEWISTVQAVRTETDFWRVQPLLPEEPGEALYSVALGEEVKPPKRIDSQADAAANPDNLRRLHIVESSDDIVALLTQPFETWMLYLHPSQRSLAEGDFNGPVKVTGAAGTGKTVVAIHRARHLARMGQRVLVATYSRRLSEDIRARVNRLCSTEERKLITVNTVHQRAFSTMQKINPNIRGLGSDDTRDCLLVDVPDDYLRFAKSLVLDEWQYVVDQQGITSLEEYLQTQRVGRGTHLGASERERMWSLFEPALKRMRNADALPWSMVCREAAEAIRSDHIPRPYDTVVIDELQDLNVQEIRFVTSLAPDGPNNLMLIGDAGQRIYPGGFSLRSLGIETRGRSRMLNINYRTTREIAKAASPLRSAATDSLDETDDPLTGIQDLRSGEAPIFKRFLQYEEETKYVAAEIARLIAEGIPPWQIAVFARIKRLRYWFEKALKDRQIPVDLPDKPNGPDHGKGVFVSTMHGAKGLEFRSVFVVGCQSGQVPWRIALDMAADEAAKQAAYQRERNLLYVSMTRARDQLYVTWTGQRSEFLKNMVET